LAAVLGTKGLLEINFSPRDKHVVRGKKSRQTTIFGVINVKQHCAIHPQQKLLKKDLFLNEKKKRPIKKKDLLKKQH